MPTATSGAALRVRLLSNHVMAAATPEAKLLPRAVIITGGSKGYGCALAEELCAEAVRDGRGLHLALVARDEKGLIETEAAVLKAAGTSSTSGVTCRGFKVDLGKYEALAAKMEGVMSFLEETLTSWIGSGGSDSQPKAELILIHNAGSLGRLAYAGALTAEESAASIDLNVTSMLLLTQLVLRRFSQKAQLPGNTLRIRVVNISSLLAVQAMASWSLYSTGKAARDMFMRSVAADVLALQQDVRTLSYAPGPMHTAMVQEVLDSCPDKQVKQGFEDMQAEDKFVDVRVSAAKLVCLLGNDLSYESGAHVDLYDA
ncbi:unnamed protein product [Polarella glacialis]|uniref:Sepiapterin reductase n=1 Tax=Polarella glacialis TaxID=89957 RepID=A0A813L408_POLGL|nr:unnamed protein product [Polarella glacialis]|mmetsp:Transcript_68404/g.110231  ORF Transcript_68404/g.110231 Transcript_68404/m.110231 type:complete len:315 (-) Transcript_68404:373-1317(-)